MALFYIKHWDCFLSGDDRSFDYCFVLRRLIFSVQERTLLCSKSGYGEYSLLDSFRAYKKIRVYLISKRHISGFTSWTITSHHNMYPRNTRNWSGNVLSFNYGTTCCIQFWLIANRKRWSASSCLLFANDWAYSSHFVLGWSPNMDAIHFLGVFPLSITTQPQIYQVGPSNNQQITGCFKYFIKTSLKWNE